MEITREQHFAIYAAIVATLKTTTEGLEERELFELANDILENIGKALDITIKGDSPKEFLKFVESLLT